MMAALYGVDVRTINYHILKIFKDSELERGPVIRKFRITAADGKQYLAQHYALQMAIAVGFKVNSESAVQFRKWVFTAVATPLAAERQTGSRSCLESLAHLSSGMGESLMVSLSMIYLELLKICLACGGGCGMVAA